MLGNADKERETGEPVVKGLPFLTRRHLAVSGHLVPSSLLEAARVAVFGQPDGVTLRQLDISLQRHSRAEVTRNDTSAATLHRLFRMEL